VSRFFQFAPTENSSMPANDEGKIKQCPTCDTDLRTADREGVEIDFCPHCYGVWLDRGKLEQIVERSNPIDWDWHRTDPEDPFRSYSEMYW
jgi:Zn-finger nucleic acid-binding protein